MPTSKSTILLFEDDENIRNEFGKAVKPFLKNDLELMLFDFDEHTSKPNAPYEDRVIDAIKKSGLQDKICLIVTDRDLSAGSVHWRGLSQASVSFAARGLGIPVACYRRQGTASSLVDELRRTPGDGLIELSADIKERAHKVPILARGFVELNKQVAELRAKTDAASRKRTASARANSPGVLLAGVLKEPAVAAHLDSFASGDHLAIGEILRVGAQSTRTTTPAVERRLVATLGVWLVDLVMKYPGVLLNQTAAASYLDIDPEVFKREDVAKHFSSAQYKKLPFADEQRPLWWRSRLDDLLSDADVTTGFELCEKNGLKRLKHCSCSVDPKLRAGYLGCCRFR